MLQLNLGNYTGEKYIRQTHTSKRGKKNSQQLPFKIWPSSVTFNRPGEMGIIEVLKYVCETIAEKIGRLIYSQKIVKNEKWKVSPGYIFPADKSATLSSCCVMCIIPPAPHATHEEEPGNRVIENIIIRPGLVLVAGAQSGSDPGKQDPGRVTPGEPGDHHQTRSLCPGHWHVDTRDSAIILFINHSSHTMRLNASHNAASERDHNTASTAV